MHFSDKHYTNRFQINKHGHIRWPGHKKESNKNTQNLITATRRITNSPMAWIKFWSNLFTVSCFQLIFTSIIIFYKTWNKWDLLYDIFLVLKWSNYNQQLNHVAFQNQFCKQTIQNKVLTSAFASATSWSS
jgi:hypothetical protein